MAAAVPRTSEHRRTWAERFAIGAAIAAAVICFAVAGSLVAGYLVLQQREVVDITNPAQAPIAEAAAAPTVQSTAPADGTVDEPTAESVTTTPPTFPPADPEAKNFLVTGADNGACIDPDSPYAAAFGNREDMGERSDTIIIFRVDPSASRVAVLSFPRDLYVTIAGVGNQARINSAYERNDPQRLIDTIYENFGVGVDHFVQVDFCAFKTLVDAVGGVAVPFRYPARDPNTGLNVPTRGCFNFSGEHALAYVRSRHYEYEDPPGSGNWEEDPTSDLGRISRQQDFLRRTLSSVLDTGPLNPRVARALIKSATQYVVTDSGLSPAKLLEFAGVLNDVEPAGILTYQIESSPPRGQRRLRAGAADRGREHAGGAGDVPRRDLARRSADAGLRPDHDGTVPTVGRRHHDPRPGGARRHVHVAGDDRRRRRAPQKRTRSASSRPAIAPADPATAAPG